MQNMPHVSNERYIEAFAQEFEQRLHSFPHEDLPDGGREFLYHQKIVNEKILRAVREEGRRDLALLLACATGKTRLGLNAAAASQAAKRRLGINGRRKDFFFTTEVGIADQAHKEAKSFGMNVGKWYGGRRELDHPFIIGTIQAAQANIAMGLRRFHKLIPPGTTDLCVYDEADCHLTEKRKRVRDELDPRISLALTATGKWPDGRSIEDEDEFGPAVERMDLKEAMLQGICSVPEIFFYESGIPGDQLSVRKQDYDLKELTTACWHAELHLALPKVYRKAVPAERRKECPTLIFVPGVKMVEATLETMNEAFGHSIRIEGLAGTEVKAKDQEQLTKEFRHGHLQMLILCRRGGRGWNLENTVLVIDAFPTYSLNKITHQDCRGLRKILPGNDLWELGMRKEDSALIQIVPKSLKYRPALFTDVLGGFEQYQQIRRKRKGGPGGPGGGIVDEIRRRIESGDPDHRLRLVKQINALEAIQRLDEIHQEDPDGFFRMPPRYGPHQ